MNPTTQHKRAKNGAKRPHTCRKYEGIFVAYTEGRSAKEIANRFDVSLSTVYMALDVMSQKLPQQNNPVYLNVLVEAGRKRIKLLNGELNKLIEEKSKAIGSGKIGYYHVMSRLINEIRKEEERLERLWGLTDKNRLMIALKDPDVITGEEHAQIVEIASKYAQPKLDKPLPEHSFRNTMEVG